MKYIKHKSYEEYKSIQEHTNKAKIHNRWVHPSNVEDIKKYCTENNIEVENVLCHGTRNGAELNYFKSNFQGIHIQGTDISSTAINYPDTIQWDFHDRKEEWVGKYDIIFTNSWDHAYDFDKALSTWMECLSPNGRLFLDWNTDTSRPFNKADCCGASRQELEKGINRNYEVENVFKIENKYKLEAYMVVVKNKA